MAQKTLIEKVAHTVLLTLSRHGPVASKQSQFLINAASHYTPVIRKCCVAPSAGLFMMFNISGPQPWRELPEFTTAQEVEEVATKSLI